MEATLEWWYLIALTTGSGLFVLMLFAAPSPRRPIAPRVIATPPRPHIRSRRQTLRQENDGCGPPHYAAQAVAQESDIEIYAIALAPQHLTGS